MRIKPRPELLDEPHVQEVLTGAEDRVSYGVIGDEEAVVAAVETGHAIAEVGSDGERIYVAVAEEHRFDNVDQRTKEMALKNRFHDQIGTEGIAWTELHAGEVAQVIEVDQDTGEHREAA